MRSLTTQDLNWLQKMGISTTAPQPAAPPQQKEPMVPRSHLREIGELATFYEGEAWRKQRIIERQQLMIWTLAIFSMVLAAYIIFALSELTAPVPTNGAVGAGRVRVSPPLARVTSEPAHSSGFDFLIGENGEVTLR